MPAEKAARFRFSAFMDPLWRPTTFRPKIALAATTYLSTFTGTRATDIPSNAGLGHEIWAEVTEAGNAVDRVKVGDRVVLPFNLTGSHFLSGEKSSPDRQRRLTYNSVAIPNTGLSHGTRGYSTSVLKAECRPTRSQSLKRYLSVEQVVSTVL